MPQAPPRDPGSTASSTTITSDASPRGNLPLDTQRRPYEAEAANLFFQLVSSRYEQASLIVTSNKPFGRWARSSATTSSPQP